MTRERLNGNAVAHGLALELDGADERPHDGATKVAGGVLLGIAVVLTALNLRPAVTSVAPLLGEMRESLGTSSTWAGVLTSLPPLCFAAAGLAAPWLSARIGLGRTISVALAALTVGLALRGVDGPYVVLGATLVASAGIALANVLIPVVIKSSFPARIGLMTGVYTAALQGGGALGSAVAPGTEQALGGWRQALASWAVLALLALVVWMVAARRRRGAWAVATTSTTARRSLLRNRLAWTVTLFFGSQGFLAYIMMGWLPQVFIDNGLTKIEAGMLVGLMSLLGVPFALIVTPLAARSTNQSGWIVALGVAGSIATVGLIVAPGAAPLLWSVLMGIGMSTFSLALAVIALRARNADDTAQLSGMAQGFGYLLASTGPLLFGMLHDLTHGWTWPFVLVLAVYAVQIVAGVASGRNRYV